MNYHGISIEHRGRAYTFKKTKPEQYNTQKCVRSQFKKENILFCDVMFTLKYENANHDKYSSNLYK